MFGFKKVLRKEKKISNTHGFLIFDFTIENMKENLI